MSRQDQTNPLGILEPLLNDPQVNGVMVDGPNQVYVERDGKLEDVPTIFRDEAHLLKVIDAILESLGRKADESNPLVDARLPNGSRVNVVMPPISLTGPVLVIRNVIPGRLTIEDLLRFGSWSEEMVTFIRACVRGRLNIVVAGGTSSGKTSVLNLIAGMIPENERVIVIQHDSELVLSHKYLVSLETRPPNLKGKGEINVQDLVKNVLHMRPDRIVVSELLGGTAGSDEAFLALISAMNRGHEGTLLNLHATSPHDVLVRMEMMASSANPSLPLLNIRQQIASSIDLITYQQRLRDGTRKLTKVAEVVRRHGDVIALQDIFEFRQTGVENGKIAGHFTATGTIPRSLERIQAAGVDLPLDFFRPQ